MSKRPENNEASGLRKKTYKIIVLDKKKEIYKGT